MDWDTAINELPSQQYPFWQRSGNPADAISTLVPILQHRVKPFTGKVKTGQPLTGRYRKRVMILGQEVGGWCKLSGFAYQGNERNRLQESSLNLHPYTGSGKVSDIFLVQSAISIGIFPKNPGDIKHLQVICNQNPGAIDL